MDRTTQALAVALLAFVVAVAGVSLTKPERVTCEKILAVAANPPPYDHAWRWLQDYTDGKAWWNLCCQDDWRRLKCDEKERLHRRTWHLD